jgi:two-component system, NarL family, sensor histidine kinase DesK
MRTWRGWSARSQVEWVELYTVQSLYPLTWLLYAVLLLGASPSANDHPGLFAGLVLGTLVLGAAGTLLLRDAIRLYPAESPLPRNLAVVVVLCTVAEGLAFLLPEDLAFQAGLVVWSTLAWSVGGLRDRRVLTGLMVALTVVPLLPTLAPVGAVFGLLGGAFIVFTVRAGLWLLGVVTELDRAQNAQAALVLAEERLRFSRDVHDVLGRRLSTIAVQAELASTLARRGDASAAERMLDVRSAAHEAMREARELARGYRATNLAQELDGAVSLLRSAGIDCRIDVTTLPSAWEEAAGWVVRETVTNVLRHSSAREVEIRYDGRSLIVRNDGVTSGADSDGAGLAGLRERLAPLGATLDAQRSGSDFEVLVTLPAGRGPA